MIQLYLVPLTAFLSAAGVGMVLRRRAAWGAIGWLLTASTIAAIWIFLTIFADARTDQMMSAFYAIALFLCLFPGVLGLVFGIWLGWVQVRRAAV